MKAKHLTIVLPGEGTSNIGYPDLESEGIESCQIVYMDTINETERNRDLIVGFLSSL